MNRVYKIKKALKVPMALAVVISIPVFADVLTKGFEAKILVSAVSLIIIFYLLTLNNILRKVRVTDQAISISGLFGTRHIKLDSVTSIDGMTMGTRQFITISTSKKNYIISNSYDDFTILVDDLSNIWPEDQRVAGLEHLRNNIISRKSDINGAWITVIILLIIILIRFLPK